MLPLNIGDYQQAQSLQGHFGGWVCQGVDDTLPEPLVAPEPVSFICPVSLAILLRHLPPRQLRPDDSQYPIEYRAVIVSRSPGRRLLRRQERLDSFPLGIAQRPMERRQRRHDTNRVSFLRPHRTTGGVTASGNCLVCPPPPRPVESEGPLRVGSGHRQDQAAHFRHGERDQAGSSAPFSSLSSCRATERSTTRDACASRQSVTKRCHAVQVRTSY
jgi:hypothetical protein